MKYLINEAGIAQGTPSAMSALEYYHVEFVTHEVIYAEGAFVESYDGPNRDNFSNFMQYERLYGAERRSKMTPFPPILRYHGRRQELKGLVGSRISNVVDVRDPIQIAYTSLPSGGSDAGLTVGPGRDRSGEMAPKPGARLSGVNTAKQSIVTSRVGEILKG